MVMNSGLISSPMTVAFPAGLRVLVVDDDPTWLKILEKMLKRCSYDVTTCGLVQEALRLLRDRKDGFDIVISDVNMPDMDGFKLLEYVGLEMDLPVIMMSVDGETSRVMKGVQHGACDYLLKPIRMKELKNIWQHVLRKRMHEVRDIECFEDRNGPDHFDGIYGGDQTFLKKRKDAENKHDEKGFSDPSTKKARVVWTVELQQKFLNAVNQTGIDSDKVGPKKILDLMNVPGLTRENVASHLQKYRLYLNRIQKEDKTGSYFGGTRNSDNSAYGSCGPTFDLQNNVSGNYGIDQQAEAKPLDSDVKSSDLLFLKEEGKASNSENYDPHKVSSSQVGMSHSLVVSLETCVNLSHSLCPSGNDIRQLSPNPIEQEPESFPMSFGCVFDMPMGVKNRYSREGFITDQDPSERWLIHSQSHTSKNSLASEPNFNVILDMKGQSCNIMGVESGIQSEPSLEILDEEELFRWLYGPLKDVGFDHLGFSDFNFPMQPKSVINYEYPFDSFC